MIKSSRISTLDDTDKTILQILQREGRLSNVELAARISLSAPATHTRVRRLEQDGYIAKYVAILDPEKVGCDLLCFIQVSLQLHSPEQLGVFLTTVKEMPEVLECYTVTGEYDCMMKVLVQNHRELEQFWSQKLMGVPGVARTHTFIVLNEVKQETAIALD